MLPASVTGEVNKALGRGQIGAALAPLEAAIDVRWIELPALERRTLRALAAHLRSHSAAAEELASAVFHPDISVRRWVRKIIQGLREDALPLAGALRARIESPPDLAPEEQATEQVSGPSVPAQQRKQEELLEEAVELLSRCSVDELMEFFGSLLDQLDPVWKQGQQTGEERQKQHAAHAQVYQRKWKETLSAHYPDLPPDITQLPPRITREIMDLIGNDPEVQALTQAMFEAAPAAIDFRTTHLLALYQATNNVLGKLLAPESEPGSVPEQAREHLWRWLEESLHGSNKGSRIRALVPWWLGAQEICERAVPLLAEARDAGRAGLPGWRWLLSALEEEVRASNFRGPAGRSEIPAPSFTSEQVRALKSNGSRPTDDETLERITRWMEESQAEESQGDGRPEVSPAAMPESPIGRVAAEIRTLEDRVSALLKPPTLPTGGAAPWNNWAAALNFVGIPRPSIVSPGPEVRIALLHHWQQAPGWKEQEAALREKALPRLREQLLQRRRAWLQAPGAPAPEHPEPAIHKLLNEEEKKQWTKSAKLEQRHQAGEEIRGLFLALGKLGGHGLYPEMLDLFEEEKLRGLQDLLLADMAVVIRGPGIPYIPLFDFAPQPDVIDMMRMVTIYQTHSALGSASRSDPGPGLAPVLCDAYRRWDRNRRQNSKGVWGIESSLRPNYYHVFAEAFYTIGVSEAREQVEEILWSGKAGTCSYCSLGALARQRRDYDLLELLLAHCTCEQPEILAIWDDLREARPDAVGLWVPKLLRMAGQATEKERLSLPLAMLGRLEKQPGLFAPYFAPLVGCLESTLPQAARFALVRLEELLDEPIPMPVGGGAGEKPLEEALSRDWSMVCERAGEKLWSESSGLAKEAAHFLGQMGTRNAAAASTAFAALSDALALNSLPLLEAILRAMEEIKARQEMEILQSSRHRIQQLAAEHPSRLARLCAKLL